MGCFDGTCAVTRSSIRSGDPVLCIWTDGEWLRDTYSILNWHAGTLRRKKDHEEEIARLRELNLQEDTVLVALDSDVKVHWRWGTYNDYGTIEEEDVDLPVCLIHRSVAERLIEIGGYPPYEGPEPTDPLVRLLGACHRARIQVGGNELLGEQHCSAEEVLHMQRVDKAVRSWRRQKLFETLRQEAAWKVNSLWWSVKYRVGKGRHRSRRGRRSASPTRSTSLR